MDRERSCNFPFEVFAAGFGVPQVVEKTFGALRNWGKIGTVYEENGKTARMYQHPYGTRSSLANVKHILTITEISPRDTFSITSPTANSVLCKKLVDHFTTEGLVITFPHK